MTTKNFHTFALRPAFCFALCFHLLGSIIFAESQQPSPTDSITIGFLLPLSGRHGRTGNWILNGAELALQRYNIHGRGPPIKLLYRDTRADPYRARSAYEQMAKDDNIIAIIGPVTPKASRAASAVAERANVIILMLTPEEGIAEEGSYTFRNSFTPTQEARAIVFHAIHIMGLRRFAVLFPKNAYGKLWNDLFSKEVHRQGAEIIASESYRSGQKDFSLALLRITGLHLLPIPLALDDQSSMSQVNFDALFIPDRFEVASLIALELPNFNLSGIPLLGTHLWNDPQAVEKTGNYEGKILFVDGFFKGSRYAFVQEFVDIFYQTFGKEPGIFEAAGYDTMNILLFLIREKKVRNREALKRALLDIKGYPGVTGATSFTEKGESKKVLYYLTIQNGVIQQIH